MPLQNGLQRPGRNVQLPNGPVEWRDELAGEIRARLYCLRLSSVLGRHVAVLQATAEGPRFWR